MDLKEVTVESLVASERFQRFCIHATEEEVVFWEGCLKQYPEKTEMFAEARKIVLALSIELSNEEVVDEFLRFKQKLNEQQQQPNSKLVVITRKNKTRKRPKIWKGLVATFLLISMIGLGKFFLGTTENNIHYTADFGKVQTYFLPDGSKVILNANSELSFQDNWTKNVIREVQLKGEAFFEIKKQTNQQAFLVHTQKGIVHVLGTSFNVLQRAEAFEVALLEGSVELTIPNYPQIKMEPGELVRTDADNFYELNTADVDAFSAWRFQRIVFKEASIKKVIQRLQDEFDWKVKVANQDLLKRKITATIPKNDPELLLKALSEIYDLTIEKLDNQEYVIK